MILALFLALVVLNLVDAWLTLRILAKGGVEINPLMRWLMERLEPTPALLGSKAAMLVLVWYYSNELGNYMVVLVGLYLAVVVRNYQVFRGMRGE